MNSVYEVTAAGFSGDTDITDDRVIWVEAEDMIEVEVLVAGTGAKLWGAIGTADTHVADYFLPEDAEAFRCYVERFEEVMQ